MSVEQLVANDPDRLLTAKEAAILCGLSVWTFNEKAKRGEIRRVRLGGKDATMGIRYRRQDIIDFIDAHLED